MSTDETTESSTCNRRQFLRNTAIAGAGVVAAAGTASQARTALAGPHLLHSAKATTLNITVPPFYSGHGEALPSTGKPSVVYSKMIPLFKQRHPGVAVNVTEITGDTEGRDKYLLQCRSHTQPDVLTEDGFWMADFGALGCNQALDNLIPAKLKNDYYPAFISRYQGRIVGLVEGTAFNSLVWYRKDLLKAAGLPEPPANWDWDLFSEYVRKLTKVGTDGKVQNYGLAMPAQDTELTSVVLLGFYWEGENTFVNAQNMPVFNNQTSIDVFNMFGDLFQKHYIMPDVISFGYDETQKAFTTGKAAMMLHGSWLTASIKNVMPAALKDQVGLAPMPIYPRTKKRSTNAGGWGVAITAGDSDAAHLAWDFVSLLAGSDPSLYVEFLLEQGYLPVLKSQAKNPAFAKTAWDKLVLSHLPVARTRPTATLYPIASLQWSKAFEQVLLGQASAKSALDQAVQTTISMGKARGYLK